MSPQKRSTDRILDLLGNSLECEFEASVALAPKFTSSELYQEISRLSRGGKVIIARGVGIFTIRQAVISP